MIRQENMNLQGMQQNSGGRGYALPLEKRPGLGDNYPEFVIGRRHAEPGGFGFSPRRRFRNEAGTLPFIRPL